MLWCLQEEVSADDLVLEVLGHGADGASQQGAGAVSDEVADEFLGEHDLAVTRGLLEDKVGVSEVGDLVLVHLLGNVARGGGTVEAASIDQDLADVHGRPGLQLVEVVGEGGLEPVLDEGHGEVVGKHVDVDQVGYHGAGLTKVHASGGAAGEKGQVEALEILDMNVGQADHAILSLLPRPRHQGREVERVVAEKLLRDLHLRE